MRIAATFVDAKPQHVYNIDEPIHVYASTKTFRPSGPSRLRASDARQAFGRRTAL
jgi:hypothetical protein